MKKIINTAPPVVMTTTRTPLTGSLTIDSGGGALSQVYDAVYDTYAPVDRRDTPLVLTPVISVIDPDTGQKPALSNVDIKWYIGNSTSAVTSATPSDEYHLQTNDGTATGVKTGALVIRHNVNAADGYAVPILCELTFTDPGRGEQYKYNAAVLLSTEVAAQDVLAIELQCPKTVTFDPLHDDTSQRTFAAKVLNGTDDITANVKLFWYLDGTLIDSSTPGYVSGQNTASLVLDAEYIDGSVVTARMATDTTAATPDHPAKAESTLLWHWPKLRAVVYSQSGESIKLASQTMTFGSIVQAYGKDISDARRNRYVKLKWYTQPSNATTKTYLASPWGYEKEISGSALFRTGGVNVNVGVDIYTVGALPSVGGSGVETLVSNPAAPVVVSTQRTPLSGSLSVSSGGGALSQVYDSLYDVYAPVDRRDTPLVLTPVVSLTDPDTGLAVPLTDLSDVEIRWYVGDAATYVTSLTQTDDYHLQTDDDTAQGTPTGALVVRHNVSQQDGYAVPILCELTCTDSSRVETYKFDAAVLLSTEVAAQDVLQVQMGNPKTVTFDPIQDDVSQRTFTAKVLNGSDDVTASVKLFWYLDGTLISSSTLGYVSGQNTDTLVLDAEYIDGSVITARFAVDTTATAPDHPAKAESTLLWHWPRLEALPYSQSGEAIRTAEQQKKFGVIVQAYGHDVPAEKVEKYCRFNWYTRPTNTTTRTDQGWGEELKLGGDVLFQDGGQHVNVGVDLYTLGRYVQVVDDSTGAAVVDDVTGALVVVGE